MKLYAKSMSCFNLVKGVLFLFVWISFQLVSAQDYYAMGQIEMREQNYVKAAHYFEQGVKAEPKNVTLINAWGLCLMKLKNHATADSILKTALDLDSQYITTVQNLAVNNAQWGRDSMAIVWFTLFLEQGKGKSIDPADAHFQIILCYKRLLYTQGLSEEQKQDFLSHIFLFKKYRPDSPYNRPLEDLEHELVHKAMFENNKYYLNKE